MRAFVLSGGGNLGPIQVGALRAFIEAGILPEMIVGCSAGALNAAELARGVSLADVERLAGHWRGVRDNDIYPGSRLRAAWRFITGHDSLYDNRNFYAFLQRCGITPAQTFGNTPIVKLYITATDLRTGQLRVFGDDPNDRLLDALMSSTALTPMHPPWEINGERFVDGGTVTPLPLRVALERGASEVYAFHSVDDSGDEVEPGHVRGVPGVLMRNATTMLRLQVQHDLLLAQTSPGVVLHYVRLCVPKPPAATDFSKAQQMIELGYTQALAYLDAQRVVAPAKPAEVVNVDEMSWRKRFGMVFNTWLNPRSALKGGDWKLDVGSQRSEVGSDF